MSKTINIACYGEVLWDVFPDKKRLGGAPLNVAARLKSFGANVNFISAVGRDSLGKETELAIKALGLETTLIQQQKAATGQVTVTLDTKGVASYDIEKNAAWDLIEATEEAIKAVKEADALIFGSLACRENHNLEALFNLIAEASYTIFDLNLRAPYYDLEVIVALMEAAHFIKMNDEELELIVMALGLEGNTLEEELKAVAKATNTASVCVTLGAEGAMLIHKDKTYTQVGYPAKVIDTVGAGDSFLATLIFGLLSNETPEDALEVACAVGSIVAGKAGANAIVTQDEINDLL